MHLCWQCIFRCYPFIVNHITIFTQILYCCREISVFQAIFPAIPKGFKLRWQYFYWVPCTAAALLPWPGEQPRIPLRDTGGGIWRQKPEAENSTGRKPPIQQPMEHCRKVQYRDEFFRREDCGDAAGVWGRAAYGDGRGQDGQVRLWLYFRLSPARLGDMQVPGTTGNISGFEKCVRADSIWGQKIPFSPDTQPINRGIMLGFLKEKGGEEIMMNRIFEMHILNVLFSEESLGSDALGKYPIGC